MRNGQITVLVLLLALMGLTIGLSQVSRSLSDLKQVTYVDSGTKAFAAAESGMQFALNKLSQNVVDCPATPPFSKVTPVPTGISTITYTICPNDAGVVVLPVKSDEVLQLDLRGQPANLQSLDILWKSTTNNVAIEVISVDSSNVLTRYSYNANGMTPPTANGFATPSVGSTCIDPPTGSNVCTDTSFNTGSCLQNVPRENLVRIKPLYNDAVIMICGRASGKSPQRLDGQTYLITVTATANNGTVKKLQTQKILPALPSIFDFAMYSGTGINKN